MQVTWPMVRHQLFLATRSARDIARRPSRANHFGRLLGTRGRGTMRLRLPWLPFSLIDELDRVVGAESCVLEYGGGGSTLWFLDQGARVTTVEHHPGWARQLRAAISADRWTLLERSLGDGGTAYVDSVRELEDETFDIILVDGRERCRCALAAMDKLKPGGLLVFDDVDRERYREGLRAIAWPRTDYIGFAPAKPTLAYTATFKKPRVDD